MPDLELHYARLREGWAPDYVRGLKLLSRRHADRDETRVKEALTFVKRLSRELWVSGRGDAWIPSPDRRTGFYPIIESIPFQSLKKIIRKNTGAVERVRSWNRIKESVQPFYPRHTLNSAGSMTGIQKRRLLTALAISLPLEKGGQPAFLGNSIPGNFNFGPSPTENLLKGKRIKDPKRAAEFKARIARASPRLRTLSQLGPDFNRGFTMRQFNLQNMDAEDLMMYEEGFASGISSKLRGATHSIRQGLRKAKRLILGELLPRATTGFVSSVAQQATTEGLLPSGTFVSGRFTTLPTFSGRFAGQSNSILRKARDTLERKASAVSRDIATGQIDSNQFKGMSPELIRQIITQQERDLIGQSSAIRTELTARRTL